MPQRGGFAEQIEMRLGMHRKDLRVGGGFGRRLIVDYAVDAARAAREHATIEEAMDLKARLEANPVTLAVKAGSEGRLFGSVKTGDVADAVAAAGLGSIDKRLLELVAPIKGLGQHEAILKLRDGVVATITISVVAAK